MILEAIKIQPDTLLSMCAVCVSDRSGGRIALLIIISSLIFFRCRKLGLEKIFQKY